MIDIHHHLLWGMDDGATSIENSVAMAKMAAADGITHIVCSPHANGHLCLRASREIDAKRLRSCRTAGSRSIAIKLGRGCDFHMSYENIQEAKVDPAKFSINGLGYLLVEVPDYGLPRGLTEIFYQLQLAGLTPILTHPEAIQHCRTDLARMAEWLRGGVLVQVTAGSVTGRMGKHAERWRTSFWKIAGSISSRPMLTIRPPRKPKMREAFEIVAKKYGPDYAHLLCVSNPLAVIYGKADTTAA